MHICIVNSEFPHFDRTSGGLRLFTLISLLRVAGHACDYLLTAPKAELSRIGERDYASYVQALQQLGVRILVDAPAVNSKNAYDAMVFEWYMTAQHLLQRFRVLQPQAKMVVDSVDLTYLRWHAKADKTGLESDRIYARQVEAEELATYARADMVITLSDEEARELSKRITGIQTFNVPNIHPIPSWNRQESGVPILIFIGSFTHEPNVDAIRWFHAEIWPRIQSARPDTRWIVIGANPPDDIRAMQNENILIAGRVPETDPYLASAWVSVAPLRFGAGMKGKVGEALAAGLPVVTTSFGTQGYGLVDRESVVLGDTAEQFATGVVWLLEDAQRRANIGAMGREAISRQFSRSAVAERIPALIDRIQATPLRHRTQFTGVRRVVLRINDQWNKHIAWRFARN